MQVPEGFLCRSKSNGDQFFLELVDSNQGFFFYLLGACKERCFELESAKIGRMIFFPSHFGIFVVRSQFGKKICLFFKEQTTNPNKGSPSCFIINSSIGIELIKHSGKKHTCDKTTTVTAYQHALRCDLVALVRGGGVLAGIIMNTIVLFQKAAGS